MIFQSLITTRNYFVCYGRLSSNETYLHANNIEGSINQFLYLAEGSGVAKCEGKEDIPLPHKQIANVYGFKNLPITYQAEENGGLWIAINPMKVTTEFEYELINTPQTRTYVSDDVDINILCLENNVLCNGKQVDQLKYVRLTKGKQVVLVVPENSSAVVFK